MHQHLRMLSYTGTWGPGPGSIPSLQTCYSEYRLKFKKERSKEEDLYITGYLAP